MDSSTIRVDTAANWLRFQELTEKVSPEYSILLPTFEDDIIEGDNHYLGFKRAPAAKANHHAFEGGLVHHLLEMWGLWQDIQPKLLGAPYVTSVRVLRAILLHDLHKAHRTYRLVKTPPFRVENGHAVESNPWEVAYGEDPTSMLMTDDVKSLWMAMENQVPIDVEQVNALLWSHGGFSESRPKWTSVLAKVCYCLDELSGNGMGRIEAGTFLNVRRREVT